MAIFTPTTKTQTFGPEYIVGKLFSFHNKAHLFHLQTTTYGNHKLLDTLYNALVDSKDAIAEYLLGVQVPTRFGMITMDPVESYNDSALLRFLDEGFDFTVRLCEYAKMRNLEQLANLASELQGAFNKARLFTTYK